MAFLRSIASIADIPCDLAIVPAFEDGAPGSEVAALDGRLGDLLERARADEDFKGKPGQTLSFHTHGKLGPQRLLLVGAGRRDRARPGDLRQVAGRGARAALQVGARTLAMALPAGLDDERGLQLAMEGLLLGRYRFDRYRTEERRPDTIDTITLAVAADPGAAFERARERAEIVADAVALTRDLVNEPPSSLTPTRLAERAVDLARAHGLSIVVRGPEECEQLGMGLFLAVARGSTEEPRLVHLTYRPAAPARRRICLVGKGITFDSGGLSLKQSQSMESMKSDMAGAAAVLATTVAVARLRADVEVHAIAACAENMPSGRAYKLGDVLRSASGKTVEITNTDAEGRLTLADAFGYASGLAPDEVLDLATLTGACVVALGPHIAGVMANDEELAARVLAAADAAGEDMWRLPLPPRLKEQLKSDVADLKNTGDRFGSALTAGLFLQEFVGDVPWLHIDSAGPSFADKEHGAQPKGGTGFGVATLVEYLAPR